jgi:hypothetical protein
VSSSYVHTHPNAHTHTNARTHTCRRPRETREFSIRPRISEKPPETASRNLPPPHKPLTSTGHLFREQLHQKTVMLRGLRCFRGLRRGARRFRQFTRGGRRTSEKTVQGVQTSHAVIRDGGVIVVCPRQPKPRDAMANDAHARTHARAHYLLTEVARIGHRCVSALSFRPSGARSRWIARLGMRRIGLGPERDTHTHTHNRES